MITFTVFVSFIDIQNDLTSDRNCRGRVGYERGPEYVFRVDRTRSDCLAELTTGADGQIWWQNALQGFVALDRDEQTGEVIKRRQILLKFGFVTRCKLSHMRKYGFFKIY